MAKRTATLMFTAFIPVTFDDEKCTEEQAFDAIERVARAALERAIEGRNIDIKGNYQDYTGPKPVK